MPNKLTFQVCSDEFAKLKEVAKLWEDMNEACGVDPKNIVWQIQHKDTVLLEKK